MNVTIAASTLFGADEQPGWLDGFGPITADAGRRISVEGPWRRLLTDPATCEPLEYGRTTYTPPADLARFVVARDRTCRFPTCHRPATEADIDHQRPFQDGGTTGQSNTWALHDGHHLGKTHHNFHITTDNHGVTWWTTPAGHTYRTDREAIGPILQRRTAATTAPGSTPAEPPEPPPF